MVRPVVLFHSGDGALHWSHPVLGDGWQEAHAHLLGAGRSWETAEVSKGDKQTGYSKKLSLQSSANLELSQV